MPALPTAGPDRSRVSGVAAAAAENTWSGTWAPAALAPAPSWVCRWAEEHYSLVPSGLCRGLMFPRCVCFQSQGVGRAAKGTALPGSQCLNPGVRDLPRRVQRAPEKPATGWLFALLPGPFPTLAALTSRFSLAAAPAWVRNIPWVLAMLQLGILQLPEGGAEEEEGASPSSAFTAHIPLGQAWIGGWGLSLSSSLMLRMKIGSTPPD